MVEAILFLSGLGAGCGLILSYASRIFYVYEDPRIAQIPREERKTHIDMDRWS